MRKARVGDQQFTLREFVQTYGASYQKDGIQPVCPECGGAVQTYDVAGALGIRSIGHEVTGRTEGSHIRRSPGFQHKKGTADPHCSLALPDDPRYDDVLGHNMVDPSIRPESRAIYEEPVMRQALDDLFTELYRFLTRTVPSAEIIREYHRICRERLYHIDGLSQHPWAMPYAAITMLKPQERQRRGGGTLEAAFVMSSRQMLRSTKRTEAGILSFEVEVPATITIHFVKKGKLKGPMRYGKGGAPMERVASQENAHAIVRAVREARRIPNQADLFPA